jgi:glyoxylase-like metal-dependent hydrolase (beta-lactamase superfamily II)
MLNRENLDEIFLVDIGWLDPVLKKMTDKQFISGVFLTHAHYDHIIDINKLIQNFPECIIYCSEYTSQCLYSEKLNLSFYHQDPIMLQKGTIKTVRHLDCINIFNDIEVMVFETPGHNPGCISYQIGNYLFTGDSYIPGYPVVTKLKGGSKLESENSLKLIRSLLSHESVICPGHFNMVDYNEFASLS